MASLGGFVGGLYVAKPICQPVALEPSASGGVAAEPICQPVALTFEPVAAGSDCAPTGARAPPTDQESETREYKNIEAVEARVASLEEKVTELTGVLELLYTEFSMMRNDISQHKQALRGILHGVISASEHIQNPASKDLMFDRPDFMANLNFDKSDKAPDKAVKSDKAPDKAVKSMKKKSESMKSTGGDQRLGYV
jgi:hypothetical protein